MRTIRNRETNHQTFINFRLVLPLINSSLFCQLPGHRKDNDHNDIVLRCFGCLLQHGFYPAFQYLVGGKPVCQQVEFGFRCL